MMEIFYRTSLLFELLGMEAKLQHGCPRTGPGVHEGSRHRHRLPSPVLISGDFLVHRVLVARSKCRTFQNLEMELWRENKKGSGKKPAPGNQELTSNR